VALPRPRRRRRIDWQSVVCGRSGHVHVGTDAAHVRPQDQLVVRELDGLRWHRCLRCDTWSILPAPVAPARRYPPAREEIEIPVRGEALRARIVLRLIAIDRILHFVILGALGIAVLALEGHQRADRARFDRVAAAIENAIGGGPVQSRGHVGFFHELDKVLSLRSSTLTALGIVLLAYAVLEGTEAVGLWLTKRWAEYLTFLATTILLPLEIYEIATRATAVKVIGFIINLAIVVYLLLAKRLFGLRGGGAADEAVRRAEMSWEALERTAPVGRSARSSSGSVGGRA
jgi:uncharacterized membrane protein (DUF2068 family)